MTEHLGSDGPQLSVVMATYRRGRHILPSIRSVLGQSFDGWELIVAGDGCTDETEEIVRGVTDDRVRWINRPECSGSQSGPNNAGISAARGQFIAYLGHDDIWDPSHLERIMRLFHGERRVDFAVSGAIYHMPNGIAGSQVTGIFDDDSAKHHHFFPPSSFAHRRLACDAIGEWRMPEDIRAPVDEDFLIRAAAADLTFASTGAITVHKFAQDPSGSTQAGFHAVFHRSVGLG